MKTKPNKIATTKRLDDGKKYAIVPVGTYVLRSTYEKNRAEIWRLKTGIDSWKLSYTELTERFSKQTDRLNQLSKEYNDLVAEHKKMKDQEFDYKNQLQNISQERNDLFNANISLSVKTNDKDTEILSLKSRLFWLSFWAWPTTATTLLFIGYYIWKTWQ